MNLKTLKQTKLNNNDTHLIVCSVTKGNVYIGNFVLRVIHVSAIIWRALWASCQTFGKYLFKHLLLIALRDYHLETSSLVNVNYQTSL